jgi:hypothetical protein
MDGACSTYGRKKNTKKVRYESVKENIILEILIWMGG